MHIIRYVLDVSTVSALANSKETPVACHPSINKHSDFVLCVAHLSIITPLCSMHKCIEFSTTVAAPAAPAVCSACTSLFDSQPNPNNVWGELIKINRAGRLMLMLMRVLFTHPHIRPRPPPTPHPPVTWVPRAVVSSPPSVESGCEQFACFFLYISVRVFVCVRSRCFCAFVPRHVSKGGVTALRRTG